jgi:type I pantothenate kinase
VAGSVAAGKSTFCRVMQALLARWPNTPRVELVTTDGFLFPNVTLERDDLMGKKGFPESYDGAALLRFISDVKAGRRAVEAPVYSHLTYDIVPGDTVVVDRPDILIVEGLNVLLPGRRATSGRASAFVSDFFDFSIYLDAKEDDLERWYVDRFMRLRETSFRDPRSYFKKYADLDAAAAEHRAKTIWRDINLANLHENVLPTRERANLILTKGPNHRIQDVELRKL